MSERISIVYQRDIIRGVLTRWKEQYRGWTRPLADGRTPRQIARELARLDLETCPASDVEAIVGKGGWVTNECDLCKQCRPTVVRLGDEPDYDARWVNVCLSCLKSAEKVLKSAGERP